MNTERMGTLGNVNGSVVCIELKVGILNCNTGVWIPLTCKQAGKCFSCLLSDSVKQSVKQERLSELVDCPFCGAWQVHVKTMYGGDKSWVSCRHCKAIGPKKPTIKEAVEAWNRSKEIRDGK